MTEIVININDMNHNTLPNKITGGYELSILLFRKSAFEKGQNSYYTEILKVLLSRQKDSAKSYIFRIDMCLDISYYWQSSAKIEVYDKPTMKWNYVDSIDLDLFFTHLKHTTVKQMGSIFQLYRDLLLETACKICIGWKPSGI